MTSFVSILATYNSNPAFRNRGSPSIAERFEYCKKWSLMLFDLPEPLPSILPATASIFYSPSGSVLSLFQELSMLYYKMLSESSRETKFLECINTAFTITSTVFNINYNSSRPVYKKYVLINKFAQFLFNYIRFFQVAEPVKNKLQNDWVVVTIPYTNSSFQNTFRGMYSEKLREHYTKRDEGEEPKKIPVILKAEMGKYPLEKVGEYRQVLDAYFSERNKNQAFFKLALCLIGCSFHVILSMNDYLKKMGISLPKPPLFIERIFNNMIFYP